MNLNCDLNLAFCDNTRCVRFTAAKIKADFSTSVFVLFLAVRHPFNFSFIIDFPGVCCLITWLHVVSHLRLTLLALLSPSIYPWRLLYHKLCNIVCPLNSLTCHHVWQRLGEGGEILFVLFLLSTNTIVLIIIVSFFCNMLCLIHPFVCMGTMLRVSLDCAKRCAWGAFAPEYGIVLVSIQSC